MRRQIGVLLILLAVFSFVVYFGLYHFWIFNSLTPILKIFPSWFVNPLSLLTSGIVGNIWLISAALAVVINGVFAVIYCFGLFIVGLTLAK